MLLEIVEILEENGESVNVRTRADLRDERKNSLRRKWQHIKAPTASATAEKKRRKREDNAKEQRRVRHERLHRIVERIAQCAEDLNTLGRGDGFDSHGDLVAYLARQGVINRLRAADSLPTNGERKLIEKALLFGEEHGFISVFIRPDGKRLLVSLTSNPAAALRCTCEETARLHVCA
jgi:hypothetical protein